MKKRLFVMLAVVLMLAFAFTACAPKTDATPAADAADTAGTADTADTADAADEDVADAGADDGGEILIGSIQDLSGAMSVAGNMTKWGSEYAVRTINEAGGINGKMLKLVTYDCKLDSNEGINIYNRLIQEGAVAIVGPALSPIGIPLAPIAEEKKVPVVGQFMDERSVINEQTGEPWSFMFLAEPSCNQQAEIMANYAANTLGLKSVGILYDVTLSYAEAHVGPFKEYMESAGVDVVGIETFSNDTKDYKAQVTKLLAADPEGIFVPNHTQANALVYKQLRQLGFDGYVIGNNTYNPPFPELVDGLPVDENLVFLFNIDMMSDYCKDISEAYMEENDNQAPHFNVAFGYDDVMIIANALKNVSDVTDSVEIAQYIEQHTIDVETASGLITFDPETHMTVGMGAYIAKYDSELNIELIEYCLPE